MDHKPANMEISQPGNMHEHLSVSTAADTIMRISGPDGSGDADIHEQIRVAVLTIAMSKQEVNN